MQEIYQTLSWDGEEGPGQEKLPGRSDTVLHVEELTESIIV